VRKESRNGAAERQAVSRQELRKKVTKVAAGRTGKEVGTRFLVAIVGALFITGILALALSNVYKKHELAAHLIRDFGIACVISALVTILYEAYVRYRFDIAKIDTLLNTVYGSSIPLEVWQNIRDTLLSRNVLREDAAFHLRVKLHPSRTDMALLEIQIEYTLVRLRNVDYTVTHYLDAHISDKALLVPRFLHASVGSDAFQIDAVGPWKDTSGLATLDANGCLSIGLASQEKSRVKIPIAIRRLETRNVPGSYFFVMTEVTTGLRVYLEECPPTIAVTLASWPIEPEIDLSKEKYALLSQIFLPGHSLEFKLLATQPRPATGSGDASPNAA
jgi:hypothetical protein